MLHRDGVTESPPAFGSRLAGRRAPRTHRVGRGPPLAPAEKSVLTYTLLHLSLG